MEFKSCALYGIKNIKTLQKILGFTLFEYHDKKKIYKKNYYSKIIEEKHRLIEAPCKKLKHIQRKIMNLLSQLDFPEYLISVREHCFMDSVIAHADAGDFIIKIDIAKFYPNTARDKVYKFWKKDMCMSPSVANIITNLTTVTTSEASKDIKNFYITNGIMYENHLPTGGPSSSILAYLVNRKMFDEIQQVVNQHNGIITIYADDIIISKCNSPSEVFTRVRKIIFNNGYRTATNKSCIKYIYNTIEINGLVHTKTGETRLPNRLYKEITELRNTKNPDEKARLQGLLSFKNQFNRKFKPNLL